MKLLLLLLPLLLLSCGKKSETNTTSTTPTYQVIEIPDSSGYYDMAYQVINGQDSSLLYFELNNTALGVRYYHFKPNYVQLPLNRIEQLALVLSYMKEKGVGGSLTGLFLRGLEDYGTYSISLTREYIIQFGNSSPRAMRDEYAAVEQMVLGSELIGVVNKALSPLNLNVKSVSLEKIFLSPESRAVYPDYVPLKASIPNTLLSATAWLKLTPANSL